LILKKASILIKHFSLLLFLILWISPYIDFSQSKINSQDVTIDHIPIAFSDLSKLKSILVDDLQFTLKEGTEHQGIKNCFIKFKDGTYLEFVSPIDTITRLGRLYSKKLEAEQLAYFIALKVTSKEHIISKLTLNSIPYTFETNRFWEIITFENQSLFFIKYLNSNWKENERFTNHPNGSIGLKTIWLSSKKSKNELSLLQKFGNDVNEQYELEIGNQSIHFHSVFDSLLVQEFQFGISIQVNSLNDLEKRVSENLLTKTSNDALLFTNKSLPFFIEFVE